MRLFTTAILWLIGISVWAQDIPNTNIYLLDIKSNGAASYSFSNPKFITNFNEQGYNNQPIFIGSNTLLVTAQLPGETQTDIYQLDLAKKEKIRFTATAESEYSPLPIPLSTANDLKTGISCVRVDADDTETQRLWRYPYDRSDSGYPLLEKTTGIGYYVWSDYQKLVLFMVGEPHTLAIADVSNQDMVTVTSQVGRCLKRFANGDVGFVHMIDDSTWLLKRLNMTTYQPSLITAMPKDVEDFVVLLDGTIIVGQGSKLFKFNKMTDISWKEIADLSGYGIRNISRMAISKDQRKIAIVNESRL